MTRIGLAFASILLTASLGASMWSTSTVADDGRRLRALVTQHFLDQHYAIFLPDNPTAKSGDVLTLPGGATYISRKVCYDLPEVKYYDIDFSNMKSDAGINALLGAAIPAGRLADIAVLLNGELTNSNKLVVNPLNVDTPPSGTKVLETPKSATDCNIIRDMYAGFGDGRHILATTILHGQFAAGAQFHLAGQGGANAEVAPEVADAIEQLVKVDLGPIADAEVGLEGEFATVSYIASPSARSLAAQSDFLDHGELDRLYERYQGGAGFKIKQLVNEYVLQPSSEAAEAIQQRLKDLLTESKLWFGSVSDLFGSIFAGKGIKPIGPDGPTAISQDRWDALAVIAAAHEVAGEQKQ